MAKSNLLVVEWSPTQVAVFDPLTGTVSHAASLAAIAESVKGREAVVAVSRRSAFVRTMFVPNASRNEIEGILRLQLEGVLPFAPNEYTLAFRLGSYAEGKGRLAAIAAIKTESLQRIGAEAQAAGLRVRAILPAGYGAWLAARAHGLADCAVVESGEDALNIDVVRGGELHYSRSIPTPDSLEEVEDEIARTFAVAEIEPAPLVAVATTDVAAPFRDSQSSLQRLADPAVLSGLISFELPSKREAKTLRNAQWQSRRAIAAAVVAGALGGYAYSVRHRDVPRPSRLDNQLAASLKTARKAQAEDADRLERLDRAKRLLDVAFNPAQTLGDIATVLASAVSTNAWFTGLSIARGAPLTITGLALNDKEVTAFLNAVGREARFEGMKVVSTTKTAVADTPLTQFYIVGTPVGILPYDRPLKEKHLDGKPKP